MEIAINRSKAVRLPQSTIDAFKLYHRGYAYSAVKMIGYWSGEVLDLRADTIHSPETTGILAGTKASALEKARSYIDMIIAESRAL